MPPFDPYHVWLGIPPEQQPPDHYRLLGVPQFEADTEVIANAADRTMAHLRTFQNGPRAAFSERLLNEVAAARLCLLDPVRKAEYDAALQARSTTRNLPDTNHPHPPDPSSLDAISDRGRMAIAVGAVGMVVIAAAFAVWAAIRSQREPPPAPSDSTPAVSKTGERFLDLRRRIHRHSPRRELRRGSLKTQRANYCCWRKKLAYAREAHYKYSPVIDALVEWTNPADAACWDVAISRPGVFVVLVTYACPTGEAGGTFQIACGTERVTGKVLTGDGDNVFREEQIGFLKLAQRGPVTIQLTPVRIPATELLRLRSIRLVLARPGVEARGN